jgi:hypothetical protein
MQRTANPERNDHNDLAPCRNITETVGLFWVQQGMSTEMFELVRAGLRMDGFRTGDLPNFAYVCLLARMLFSRHHRVHQTAISHPYLILLHCSTIQRINKTMPMMPMLAGEMPATSERGVVSSVPTLVVDPKQLLGRILHNPHERRRLKCATLKGTLIPGGVVMAGEPWESQQARSNPTLGEMRIELPNGGPIVTCGMIVWCILSGAVGAVYQLCQFVGVYADEESGERLLSVYLLERFADDNLVSRFDAPPFVHCSGTHFAESIRLYSMLMFGVLSVSFSWLSSVVFVRSLFFFSPPDENSEGVIARWNPAGHCTRRSEYLLLRTELFGIRLWNVAPYIGRQIYMLDARTEADSSAVLPDGRFDPARLCYCTARSMTTAFTSSRCTRARIESCQ